VAIQGKRATTVQQRKKKMRKARRASNVMGTGYRVEV